jgi:LysR family glycine cleavage system transcriptional activator
VAVRHGDGTAPGLDITRLYTEELVPVCSPRLLRGPHPLRQPGDLTHHTLLHLDHRGDWTKWLDAAGVEGADLSRGPVLNQASMGIDAAVDGQGVVLARTGLAAWDLIAGRLVRPFSLALPVPYAYWIVCPMATAKLPKIVTFRDWLVAEAADDTRRLGEIP